MAETTPVTESTTSSDTPKKSKGLPTIAKVAIGCVAILIVLGIVSTLLVGWVVKKAGTSLFEKAIESQTGVKTNIEDIEKGKMTFTDEKSGQSVELGTEKIPETFPKDFPIYPGAKVTSSLSGSGQEKQGGFWVTFTTPDAFDAVTTFYKTNLKANGWVAKGTLETDTNLTQTVTKGKLEGSITIDRSEDAAETTILIMLGDGTGTLPEEPISETPAGE